MQIKTHIYICFELLKRGHSLVAIWQQRFKGTHLNRFKEADLKKQKRKRHLNGLA